MADLQNRVFIVTGAGGAIAQAINAALLKAGAELALADRSGNAERARDALGSGLAVLADLATISGAEQMVQATLSQYGRVDGLIHTVGGFAMRPVLETEPDTVTRMIELNLFTLTNAVSACLPHILASPRGFIGGIAAAQVVRGAGAGAAAYTAAKAAVAHYLKSLDGELKSSKASTGIVYPMGAVDTPANRRDMPNADPNTWVDPAEIGAAFVHMATRSARGRIIEMQVFPPR